MEQFSNKDKTPAKNTLPGQKPVKQKKGWWHWFKNLSIEPRKIVIWDGDKVVKLIPAPPEGEEVTVAVEKPVVTVERPAAVTPVAAPKPPVAPIPPVAPPKPVVKEKVVEAPKPPVKPVPPVVPPKPVVKEKVVEAPKPPVRPIPPVAPPKPVVEEKVVEVPKPPVAPIPPVAPPKPVVEEKRVEVLAPVVPVDRLKIGLEKTRGRFWSRLKDIFSFRKNIDKSVLEELEDILIGADIGVRPVQKLLQELNTAWESKAITETTQIQDFIKVKLKEDLRAWQTDVQYASTPPTVIMVVGVNGAGKTTSIAKLAHLFIKEGKKVMVAACDTFRAAAVEQLEIWSKRIGADIVKHQTGSDPAAVAYDSLEAGIARGCDVLIVDTAGRLHTHENLMNELGKIKRVIAKRLPGAPHEVLMVLDATTGQNAVSQAKMFKQTVDVTGIFLAKLDGTAKGGIVLGMRTEINVPVKFVGLGEKPEDIERFDPDTFVNALFE